MTASAIEINAIIFDQPSGNVKGIGTAFVLIKGKQRRIAHATLFVDGEPEISFDMPKKATQQVLSDITDALCQFREKLNEVDA
tara:strand:- start:8257 stop:8505 length:249 start_codon:yes stop_codon:yes gene_type:complete